VFGKDNDSRSQRKSLQKWREHLTSVSKRRFQGKLITKQNSVVLNPRANYTDWATATCRRNLVPTFVHRAVSRGQRGGSPTVVNLCF
jgi:hypothetical protein